MNILREKSEINDRLNDHILDRFCFNYLDPILIRLDCLFEIRKIAVCFLWLSLPGHYRVTDEALLAKLISMTHLLSYECFHCS